jgi:PEP-CTERM motif
MKNTGMFKRLLMVAIPLALAAPTWASICPGAPTALSPSFTNPTGCTVGNNQFSNFVVTSGTTGIINGITLAATTWPTPPTASTVDLHAFGSGIDLTTPGFCGTPTASITPNTFCVGGSATAEVSSITYDLHAVSGTISKLALDGTVHTHSSGQTGAVATVFREFCLGTTTFSQSCTGYGVLQIGTLNGHNLSQAFSASTMFAGVTDIAIRDTIFLQRFGPTGEFAGVSNFDPLTTPEPATLGMVGLALAGLGALRFRKRKV